MNWIYEDGRIYSVDEKGELMAEATFIRKSDNHIDVDHVYVNPILRGKGVAGTVMEAVVGYLRQQGLKASASCSYANAWFMRHKEMCPDVISDKFENQAASCKIDGKH